MQSITNRLGVSAMTCHVRNRNCSFPSQNFHYDEALGNNNQAFKRRTRRRDEWARLHSPPVTTTKTDIPAEIPFLATLTFAEDKNTLPDAKVLAPEGGTLRPENKAIKKKRAVLYSKRNEPPILPTCSSHFGNFSLSGEGKGKGRIRQPFAASPIDVFFFFLAYRSVHLRSTTRCPKCTSPWAESSFYARASGSSKMRKE